MLQAMAWAYRTTVSTSTGYAPGELTFGRDMIMNLCLHIDWASITQKRLALDQKSVLRENENRLEHEYKIGDKVLITKQDDERHSQCKIGDVPNTGPFEVLKVNKNRTVKLQKRNFNETINTCRIKPF